MKGIQLDENGDLMIVAGSMVIEENKSQCASLILQANEGDIKEFPALGVGLEKFIKSTVTEKQIQRKIRINLEADNIEVSELTVNNNNIRLIV